jgi:NDP-sugar pyrophosphorylase family protein
VILAGGRGTRLRPYTTVLPKPLMPIGEHPILEVVVRWLAGQGVTDLTVSVGHLGELIMAVFGDGERLGVRLRYAQEDQPLGTMGPLSLLPRLADHEDFLVLNGDVLTDLDLAAMHDAHRRTGATMTIATHRRDVKIDFGVLHYDAASHRITDFVEKPTHHYDVSMGVYLLSRRCLPLIPAGRPFGFDDLVLALLARGETLHAFPHTGEWLDIGRPGDYDRANEMAAERRATTGEEPEAT